ncbi:MAG: valine--tRNA ligase [Defluviitaleaceae bacterium]|nr:valine--tRNA ligase [Defluviitaleaceae bacterium]MCL2239557.1 valine--tRNA ligase [Defluviitaleaceae bacterium]
MTNIPKHYDPSREDEIYTRWLERGYFRAKVNPGKKPYTIMMPPPNITDRLHIGHAFGSAVRDMLIRTKRMQGYEVLYMPGTDHAAISTEVQVVKTIAKEGLTKEGMGREKFLERVWAWREEYGSAIVNQFKKIGVSCDWARERFTMDEGLSAAVLEAFVRLYDEGKIYRGERLVNWCVKCQTTISDAEVEHEDGEGTLYHFKYPLTDGSGHISFATTRPETMLGDTAVAVHPQDARYASYVGRAVVVPLFGEAGREIPVVADGYVDREYGTGVVKITPAHDPNDFELGQRHSLPCINVMHDDGTINENGGPYAGLTRAGAREKIIADMTALGLYVKEEKISHAKGTHDRCHEVVEPLVKLQWFLRMEELAKPALEAYTAGKLKFNRGRFGKIYQHWLKNIRDWCISRQIWWGHRIPAYYCPAGHITVAKTPPEKCATCGATALRQDEDTLDTWFSSALWPFSTLGWPERTPELDYFYPTNVLSTAQEIIFFWVVRMVFMGQKFMGDIPFTHVLIHGTVVDEHGRKMSKSVGNGIDPLAVVEKYGADVLRLTLLNGNAIDSNTRFYWERVEWSRNFMNKLWNAARFVLMHRGEGEGEEASPIAGVPNLRPAGLMMHNRAVGTSSPSPPLPVEDKWILSRVNALVREVTEKIDAHELGMATQKTVDFIWDEFCDWYVEIVKPRLRDDTKPQALAVLVRTLTICLKLLHPTAPFITEDLYLALQGEETVTRSPWPVFDPALADPAAEKAMENIKESVRAVRNIRAEKQVPPSQKIAIHIHPDDTAAQALFTQAKGFVGALCNASEIKILSSPPPSQEGVVSLVAPGATLYLPLASLVDSEKERARLEKERKRLQGELARIDAKLFNEGFMAKAPEALIAAEREKRAGFGVMLANVEKELRA